MVAPHLDSEVATRDSFISCAPFGVAGAAIVSRMYVFQSGGWGRQEWNYSNQLPKRLLAAAEAMVGRSSAS
jgi:hypothetical protein